MTKFSGNQNYQLCIENHFSCLHNLLNFGRKNQEAKKEKKSLKFGMERKQNQNKKNG